jgi:hypothetical protein
MLENTVAAVIILSGAEMIDVGFTAIALGAGFAPSTGGLSLIGSAGGAVIVVIGVGQVGLGLGLAMEIDTGAGARGH